jgi:KTSC domain
MRRRPVESSALLSVGYDEGSLTLEVEFASGEIYRYFDVDPAEAEALLRAGSMGRYLNEQIKPLHRYRHVT